jgi:predicted metal-dependent hydrolase
VFLSWRLVHLDLHLVDYVVAHELAHLDEMNHSAKFWRVVERVYPNWRAARRELRERERALPEL